MRIWKWTLELTDLQNIEMPADAQILSVQIQHREIQLWALCNESAEKVQRTIAIYGTGNPIPDEPGTYISTFQVKEGMFVFHAFDLGVIK